MDFDAIEKALNKKQGERELLEAQHEKYLSEYALNASRIMLLQKVIVLLQHTSDYARTQMTNTIEDLVTNALQVVFGENLRFEVELTTRAGAPAAEFWVITPEGLRCRPMDAKGGGLVDVISTALRLAVLELYYPSIAGPIILDEPGKMISAEYASAFAWFLKEYSQRIGRQILMITHNTELAAAADKTFHVRIKNGESEVVEA